MELLSLPIPTDFSKICLLYKDYKRFVYNSWMILSYDALKQKTSTFYSQLKTLQNSRDQKSIIRLSIGVRLLGKVRPPYLEDLIQILIFQFPITDPLASHFASYIVSRFCKKKFFKDISIFHSLINNCSEWISPPNSRAKMRSAIDVLKWFSSIPSSLLLSIQQQVLSALANGIFSSYSDFRDQCFEIANSMLSRIHQPHQLDFLKNKAEIGIQSKQMESLHGALLSYSLLSKHHPALDDHVISELMEVAKNQMNNKEKYIISASIRLIIFMAPFCPILYRNHYSNLISEILFSSENMEYLNHLIYIFESFPDTLSMKSSSIVYSISKLFSYKNDEYSRLAFMILEGFMNCMPLAFGEKCPEIAKTIVISHLTPEFATIGATVFSLSNRLWNLIQHGIFCNIRREIENRPITCLKIISSCPRFHSEYSESLIPIIRSLMDSKSLEIRSLCPSAMVSLIKNSHPNQIAELAFTLLSKAITEEVVIVRVSLIHSLNICELETVSCPRTLQLLSVLSNDESTRVKNATIELLCRIADINPMMTFPILRKAILNSLNQILNSLTLSVHANSTKYLSKIIKTCQDILPVYIPVILQASLTFLKNRLCLSCILLNNEEMRLVPHSFFERFAINRISIDLISCISLIFSHCHYLISESVEEIVVLFLGIIESSPEKGISLAILNAICMIIDVYGLSILDKIPNFCSTLYSMGSRFISKKIQSSLFKLLGRIGPRDPSVFLANNNDKKEEKNVLELSSIGKSISHSDWYLSVVSSSLLSLLEEDIHPNLIYESMEILAFSLHSTSDQIKPYFNRFISLLLKYLKSSPLEETPKYFYLLQNVLLQHGEWLKPFVKDFSQLFEVLYSSTFFSNAISMFPNLIRCLSDSFSPYISKHLPVFLDLLLKYSQENENHSIKILEAISSASPYSEDFLSFIMDRLILIVFHPGTLSSIVKSLLNTMSCYVNQYKCKMYGSQVFRTFLYVFKRYNEDIIRKESIRLIQSLFVSNPQSFEMYNISVTKILCENGLSISDFGIVPPDDDMSVLDAPSCFPAECSMPNERALIEASDCQNNRTPTQWKEWFNNFVLSTISESSSQIIKKCYSISKKNYSIAYKLFNPGFLSFWSQMSGESKSRISHSLLFAMENPNTPMNVLVSIVGLAEFLEKTEQHLIPYLPLALAAERSEKNPFSLYCVTKYLDESPKSIDAINLCLRLFSQQSMDYDIQGLLFSKQKQIKLPMTPQLAEQLHDWKSAASMYEKENDGLKFLLAAYSKLRRFKDIASYFDGFSDFPENLKHETSLSFAHAFYVLNNWQRFEEAIIHAPKDYIETIITHAMGMVSTNKPVDRLINYGFELLAEKAGPLFSHGYSSVEQFLVQSQQLIEIVEYSNGNTKLWNERNHLSKLNFSKLQPLLAMRINLLNGEQRVNELVTFLKFARKSSLWEIHEVYFKSYFPNFSEEKSDASIVFEFILSTLKKSYDDAISKLDKLLGRSDLSSDLRGRVLYTKARCLVRLTDNVVDYASYLKEAVVSCEKSGTSSAVYLFSWIHTKLYNLREGNRAEHAISAIKGFINCINMERKTILPEIQQMSSILFRSGKFPEVFDSVKELLYSISSKHWITILPQLFTQIDHPVPSISEFVYRTITMCLIEHPHGSVFSLLFSLKCGANADIANRLFSEYQMIKPDITHGCQLFFSGLLEACRTNLEKWYDGIVSLTPFFTNEQIKTMTSIIEPVINDLLTPRTEEDKQLFLDFHDQIIGFKNCFNNYKKTPNKTNKQQFWEECKSLTSKLKVRIDGISNVYISSVSKSLSNVKNIEIAIPGTYVVGSSIVYISHLFKSMEVLNSKQHPKKLCIVGSNGNEYWFLLKGREDLRLDQRAMQFFQLINSFLDQQLPKIVTYFVMPLSTNAGLIQWIQDSDTMSKIIRDYFASHGKSPDEDKKKMTSYSISSVDSLLPIQRYEVLTKISAETSSAVLNEVFWLSSVDSEKWLKKVEQFSKTSAVMSIVGYILGLGDRHPSNLMIHRYRGTVIHIDLGDCFEVTKERVLFPEFIPFRLTRYMVYALGPGGVKGTFFKMCDILMKTLRKRRESIMAVLEIFVYAPVVQGCQFPKREKTFSLTSFLESGESIESSNHNPDEELAINRITRISDKLTGKDFNPSIRLSHQEQVEKLIETATDYYNLAYLYRGWNPLW